MTLKIMPYDAQKGMLLHHVALCPRNHENSLRFYRDGLGLQQIMDEQISGNWREFFNARSDSLRSIFLGDPERPDAGIVELVLFDEGTEEQAPLAAPVTGFFLLSFVVDVAATLERLENLELDVEAKVSSPMEGSTIALVRDPDGTWVELIPYGVLSE
jgi:glyoxylase I family protein